MHANACYTTSSCRAQNCTYCCIAVSHCKQVCLASSDLLHTHLALAGMRLFLIIPVIIIIIIIIIIINVNIVYLY